MKVLIKFRNLTEMCTFLKSSATPVNKPGNNYRHVGKVNFLKSIDN